MFSFRSFRIGANVRHLKLEYGYRYGTTDNNANVQSQKITVPGVTHPFMQSYTYDALKQATAMGLGVAALNVLASEDIFAGGDFVEDAFARL